jgi:hypothetical protein
MVLSINKLKNKLDSIKYKNKSNVMHNLRKKTIIIRKIERSISLREQKK